VRQQRKALKIHKRKRFKDYISFILCNKGHYYVFIYSLPKGTTSYFVLYNSYFVMSHSVEQLTDNWKLFMWRVWVRRGGCIGC